MTLIDAHPDRLVVEDERADELMIDERPAGSNDGTPAAIAEMEETIRLMTADSTAASLPAHLALGDIKPGEYFRGALRFSLPDS